MNNKRASSIYGCEIFYQTYDFAICSQAIFVLRKKQKPFFSAPFFFSFFFIPLFNSRLRHPLSQTTFFHKGGFQSFYLLS